MKITGISAALASCCAAVFFCGGAVAQTLSREEVAAGFTIAVLNGCADAVEAGKPMKDLPQHADFFQPVTDAAARSMSRAKPGELLWEPKIGAGIVSAVEKADGCQVSAYGPPVKATLDAIGDALIAKGYLQEWAEDEPLIFSRSYAKTIDGRKIRVSIGGNEPGAPGRRFRFSTLIGSASIAP